MIKSIRIRCGNCGKVLLVKCTEERKMGICPKCRTKLIIPKLPEIEARKSERAVISESPLTVQPPEGLVSPKEKPFCRLVYTEVPPFEFALRCKDHVPILDLSENGLSFLIRKKEAADFLTLEKVILIEIDFPILGEPIYPYVRVRWTNVTQDQDLLQIGVEFFEPHKDLQKIMANLIRYVLARSDAREQVDSGADGENSP